VLKKSKSSPKTSVTTPGLTAGHPPVTIEDARSRAESWLQEESHLQSSTHDYAGQEAVVYFASKGRDVTKERAVIEAAWIRDERRIDIELDPLNIDFWQRLVFDNEQETVTATMLRTAEWLDIGVLSQRFRNLAAAQSDALTYGLEPGPVGWWAFQYCRSALAIHLFRDSLRASLQLVRGQFDRCPWRAVSLRDDKLQRADSVPIAASLLFALSRLGDVPGVAFQPADGLDMILSNQLPNGLWSCWSGDEEGDTITTAIVLHTLGAWMPVGGKNAMQRASRALLNLQQNEGNWSGGRNCNVFVTVLVLDALAMATEGSTGTCNTTAVLPAVRQIAEALPVEENDAPHANGLKSLSPNQQAIWDALLKRVLGAVALAKHGCGKSAEQVRNDIADIRLKCGKTAILHRRHWGYYRPDAEPDWTASRKPRRH
jgi:hypothetical protein